MFIKNKRLNFEQNKPIRNIILRNYYSGASLSLEIKKPLKIHTDTVYCIALKFVIWFSLLFIYYTYYYILIYIFCIMVWVKNKWYKSESPLNLKMPKLNKESPKGKHLWNLMTLSF